MLFLTVAGCSQTPVNMFTVGVITKIPGTIPAFTGFKEGMAEQGYREDVNLVYLYREISDTNEQLIRNTIKELMGRKIDLLLTFEYDLSLKCKELTKDIDLPIIFISNPYPVEMGLVNSLGRPGSNLTGVRMPETSFKALEWLTVVMPRVKNVYLPYNPDDDITEREIFGLKRTASGLGIELVFDEIHSVEETIAAIESLSGDIDAVFRIPSKTLNLDNQLITQAAMKFGIPTCAALSLDEDVMLTFTGDFFHAGKLASRLAHQIRKGISPSDLPVESSNTFLIINLKTAEKIGLTIPQDVLSQADKIIR